MSLTSAVAQALDELTQAFRDYPILHRLDGQGGAWVIVDDLPLSSAFLPATSWIGFAISAVYPRADVYPHFVCPELQCADGSPLTTPLNAGQTMPGFERPAVMLSRRSNRWDPSRDTATLKLHRVLLWFAEHDQQQVAG
jgi:hypothetical protein